MAPEAGIAALAGPAQQAARRRRVRRSALVCVAIAAAFYLGFILLILTRGGK